MAIREKLESIFDELRSVGNEIPMSNRQCAILVLGGLETLDFGKVADDLLGKQPDYLPTPEAADAYDAMAEAASVSVDGIVNDLRAVIDEWEE